MNTEVVSTGWLFTDCRQVTCPRCNAQPTIACTTPGNRKAKYPHTQRVKAYVAISPPLPLTRAW